MSFFLRLFGKSGGPQRPIEEMTLRQVFDFLREQQSGGNADELIAVFRRLTDLALFEPGIPDKERDAALNVAEALHSDIEKALAHDPEALLAFQEAADFHLNQARHSGYGSLHWLMQEQGIEAGELIEFIARAEHAQLLPAFLEMMEPSDIAQMRAHLLSDLARLRAEKGEHGLQTLSRLVNTNDGSMTMLLSGPELSAIRRGRTDEPEALEVLRDIGVEL